MSIQSILALYRLDFAVKAPSRQWPINGGVHMEYDHNDGARTVLFKPTGSYMEAVLVEHWSYDGTRVYRPEYTKPLDKFFCVVEHGLAVERIMRCEKQCSFCSNQ